MNARLKRLLLPLLRAAKEGKPPTFRMKSAASQALFLIGKPSLKRKSANQQKKAGRAAARQARNEETAMLRLAVMLRAKRFCENCGINCGDDGHLDHWLGGSGRRRERQSTKTAWLLCVECHYARTNNFPDAAFWNGAFKAHCARYGYPVIEHIIHNPVSAAAGGSK